MSENGAVVLTDQEALLSMLAGIRMDNERILAKLNSFEIEVATIKAHLEGQQRNIGLIPHVDTKVNGLLEGLQRFLEFTESMKGHPLLAAFAPPGRPKK